MKWIFLLILTTLVAFSADNNPASKAYVFDVVGDAIAFESSGNVKEVEKREVYTAEGISFVTNKKSNQTFVLSNGVGVHMEEDSHLDIKRFMQEPFTPNRIDLDVEPSISQTKGFIPHGYIAICTPKIVAGSNMEYETAFGRVKLHTSSKIVINRLPERMEVISVEGDVRIQINGQNFGSIKVGEKALVNGKDVVVQKAEKEELKKATEMVAFACNARKTVIFEARNAAGTDRKEISVQQVVPIKLPTEYTVSPARLPE
jgi:hypothetical protein